LLKSNNFQIHFFDFGFDFYISSISSHNP